MPTVPERSQVVSGAPAAHFRGVKSFNTLLSKATPDLVSHCEHHEGDGGEGTKSTYVLPDMHPHDGGHLTLKTVMEVYDEATHTYVMSTQGDPRYTKLTFTVRFLPGPSADTSTLKWSCEYTPVSANTPGPDNIMDLVPQVFENFAPHAEEHHANQQAA